VGWWMLGKGGGIAEFTGGPVSTEMDLYGGDEPADIMDGFLRDHEAVLTRDLLVRLFVKGEEPAELPVPTLLEARRVWREFREVWRMEWCRDPHPLEMQGLIEFCDLSSCRSNE